MACIWMASPCTYTKSCWTLTSSAVASSMSPTSPGVAALHVSAAVSATGVPLDRNPKGHFDVGFCLNHAWLSQKVSPLLYSIWFCLIFFWFISAAVFPMKLSLHLQNL